MFNVLSFGELLVDRFAEYEKMGGSPANIVYNLNKLGNKCALISALGNDKTANFMFHELNRHEISCDFISQVEKETGFVQVAFSAGEAQYTIKENVAWDYINSSVLLERAVTQCKAFYFSTLAQRSINNQLTLQNILYKLPTSALKILDVNLRPPFYNPKILHQSFLHANIIKMNEIEYNEISRLFKTKSLNDFLFSKFNTRMIIKTFGKQGSACITPNNTQFYTSSFIDTTNGDSVGVGDAFLSCVIHHLLKKTPIDIMMLSSNKFAGYVAAHKGAMVSFTNQILAEVH